MEKFKLFSPQNRIPITILISLFLTVIFLLLFKVTLKDLIDKIEFKSYDWRTKIAADARTTNKDILLLVIDDISLQHANSNPELGFSRWPWPRSFHADVIKYLKKAGAKVIIFDILFQGKEGQSASNDISDNALTNSLKGTDNVFFAATYTYSNNVIANYPNKKQIEQTLLKVSSDEFRQLIKRFSLKIDQNNLDPAILSNITFFNASNILTGILENAAGIGSVTLPQNFDGIIRATRMICYFDGNYYPSLPLAVYLHLTKNNKLTLGRDFLQVNKLKIPLANDGSTLLNWYGAPGQFNQARAIDVVLAQRAIDAGQPDPLDPKKFKDKIIIIGITATATDIISTPMSGAYPGPEIIATSLNNLLSSDEYITQVDSNYSLLFIIILCSIIGLLIIRIKSGIHSILISIAILIAYINLTIYLFVNDHLWMDMIFPSISIVFTIMITFTSKYVVTRKAYEDTYKLATTDGLTQLYNQRYFQEFMFLSLQRARRFNTELSLLFIDIDFFKKINDTYGHRSGDLVLQKVATIIKQTFRASDFTARYGGEEMAVILENTSFENAKIAANKLLEAIALYRFNLNQESEIQVTVSIGVSSFPRHAQNGPELIETADMGLYYAKENGRNRVATIEDIPPEARESKGKQTVDPTIIELNIKLNKEYYRKLQKTLGIENQAAMEKWIIDNLPKGE